MLDRADQGLDHLGQGDQAEPAGRLAVGGRRSEGVDREETTGQRCPGPSTYHGGGSGGSPAAAMSALATDPHPPVGPYRRGRVGHAK